MQPGYSQPATGERWNVNMPAVIGVVFVFLLAVVIWVIASSGEGDDSATDSAPVATPDASAPPLATSTSTAPPVTEAATGTTTPAPMPATTEPAQTTSTIAPTTAPPTTEAPTATAAPATTAPGSDSGTVPGDLGVPGRPMQQPPCDGSFITVLASPIGDQATAASIAAVLDDYPGSNYLRTDETCPSLTPSSGGEPIYVVFLGPFSVDSDACAARASGPDGSYARRLSNDLPPDHFVDCT